MRVPVMYKFNDQQPSFPDFKLPFGSHLSADNRWVKLADIIPWHLIEEAYCENFNGKGAGSLSARIAFGSLYIKEKEGLSDVETVEMIQENPYMQYFLGYKEFLLEKPFDASTLTHFRKRLKTDDISEAMNVMIARHQKDQSNTVKKK